MSDHSQKFPLLSPFEQKLFLRFARRYKPGISYDSLQLEGDGQIAILAAGHRLIKKGLLCKHVACRWYLTDLGKELAMEWQHKGKTGIYVPVLHTHNTHAEGGGKTHLAILERGSTKLTVKTLCKRQIRLASTGSTIPDVTEWLKENDPGVCVICAARATGKRYYEGGMRTWGGPVARPE